MFRHHYSLDLNELTPAQVDGYLRRLPLVTESTDESRVEARAQIRKAGRYG